MRSAKRLPTLLSLFCGCYCHCCCCCRCCRRRCCHCCHCCRCCCCCCCCCHCCRVCFCCQSNFKMSQNLEVDILAPNKHPQPQNISRVPQIISSHYYSDAINIHKDVSLSSFFIPNEERGNFFMVLTTTIMRSHRCQAQL